MTEPYGAAYVRILADLDGFEDDLKKKMQRGVDNAGKSQKFREFERQAGKTAENTGQEMEHGLERGLDKEEGRLKKAGERQGSTFGSGFLTGARRLLLGRAGLFGLLGAAIAGVAGQATQGAVPALLASIPALAIGAAGAIGTLVLALHGFGAAVGAGVSGDTAAFNQALAKLSPSAQSVAREIVGLTGVMRGLQMQVQQRFFEPLQGEFQLLARSLIPVLRGQLGFLASDLGKLAASFLEGFSGKGSASAIGTILQQLDLALIPFIPLMSQMVNLFLRVGAVAAPFITALANIAAGSLGKFLTGLSDSLGNGGVLKFFTTAGEFFGSLGGALGPILGLLTDILGAFANFGSPTLALIGTLATTLRTVLAPLLPQLSTLLSGLVTGFGQMLVALTPGLTTIFSVIAQFISAVAPQLPGLVAAFLPLLQDISALIVNAGPSLAQMFVLLATTIFPALVQTLTDLQPLWAQMTPILVQLATQVLPEMVPLFAAWLQLWIVLLPILPPIVQLMMAFVPLIQAVIPILLILIPLWTALVKWIGGTILGVSTLVGWILSMITAWDKFAINKLLVPYLQSVAGELGAIVSAAQSVVSWFDKILGRKKDLPKPPEHPQIIPQYASGGRVNRPTLALVGEGGAPEAIIPMGSPTQARTVARQTGLLDMIGSRGVGGAGGGGWSGAVHVYIGDREITDIVSVVVDDKMDSTAADLDSGTRGWS